MRSISSRNVHGLRRLPSARRWAALPAVALVLASIVTATSAGATSPGGLCSGGPIASGTYRSLTVTGVCFIPDQETVTVTGNLTVARESVRVERRIEIGVREKVLGTVSASLQEVFAAA